MPKRYKFFILLVVDIVLFVWMYLKTADVVFIGSIFAAPLIVVLFVIAKKSKKISECLKNYQSTVSIIVKMVIAAVILLHNYYFHRSILFKTMGVGKTGPEILMDVTYMTFFGLAFFMGFIFLVLNLMDIFTKNKADQILDAIKPDTRFMSLILFYVASIILMGYIAINYY
jgi:hypothetical protein